MGTSRRLPAAPHAPVPPSRFDAGRPAPPMGPSGTLVLFGLLAIAAGAWLVMRTPTKLAASSLPRLAADGTPAGDAAAGEVRRRERLPHRLRRAVVRAVQGTRFRATVRSPTS